MRIYEMVVIGKMSKGEEHSAMQRLANARDVLVKHAPSANTDNVNSDDRYYELRPAERPGGVPQIVIPPLVK